MEIGNVAVCLLFRNIREQIETDPNCLRLYIRKENTYERTTPTRTLLTAKMQKNLQKEWHMLAYVIFFSYLCGKIDANGLSTEKPCHISFEH